MRGFEIRGVMFNPHDELWSENVDQALEYLKTIVMFDYLSLTFSMQKRLEGQLIVTPKDMT